VITDLRDGIATNLATIPGLRTKAYVPDTFSAPMAVVEPLTVNFDTTMGRGLDEFNFKVTVLVSRVSDRVSQASLDAYCSSSGSASVKSAIESDRTLGGKANDLRVTGITTYGGLTIGDTTYLAAEFAVKVFAN